MMHPDASIIKGSQACIIRSSQQAAGGLSAPIQAGRFQDTHQLCAAGGPTTPTASGGSTGVADGAMPAQLTPQQQQALAALGLTTPGAHMNKLNQELTQALHTLGSGSSGTAAAPADKLVPPSSGGVQLPCTAST